MNGTSWPANEMATAWHGPSATETAAAPPSLSVTETDLSCQRAGQMPVRERRPSFSVSGQRRILTSQLIAAYHQ